MRDVIEMAREVKMPYDYVTGEPLYLEKLEAFAALVRADALAEHKPYRQLQDNGSKYFGESWDKAEQPAHAPVEWMEMVVANLVREGVNKHKARELAQHFYTSPQPAQRTWVGLTNNELQPIADEYRILFGSWVEEFARAIEEKLKEKNEL